MKRLTPQQKLYCWHYASVESESWSKGGKSAELAGYKSSGNSATALLKKPKIQARIQEILKENYSENRSKCLSHFEFIFNRSVAKDDMANANVAAKHFAQACGYLRESGLPSDKKEQQELTTEQQELFDEYLAFRHQQLLGHDLLKDSQEKI